MVNWSGVGLKVAKSNGTWIQTNWGTDSNGVAKLGAIQAEVGSGTETGVVVNSDWDWVGVGLSGCQINWDLDSNWKDAKAKWGLG